MAKKHAIPEQIIAKLREAEVLVAQVAKQSGATEQTYSRTAKK